MIQLLIFLICAIILVVVGYAAIKYISTDINKHEDNPIEENKVDE